MITITDITFNGTQKQTDWARSIRCTAADMVNAAVAKAGIKFNSAQQAAMDAMFAVSDASFWIENRSENPNDWFRAAAKFAK